MHVSCTARCVSSKKATIYIYIYTQYIYIYIPVLHAPPTVSRHSTRQWMPLKTPRHLVSAEMISSCHLLSNIEHVHSPWYVQTNRLNPEGIVPQPPLIPVHMSTGLRWQLPAQCMDLLRRIMNKKSLTETWLFRVGASSQNVWLKKRGTPQAFGRKGIRISNTKKTKKIADPLLELG